MRRLLLITTMMFQFSVAVVAATNPMAVIMTQAAYHNIPPLLLVEVCKEESNLNAKARGVDDAARRKRVSARTENDYSYGICQVKIGTARWVWSKLVSDDLRRDVSVQDLYDMSFNAATAAIFLDWLHNRYGDWKLALVAYNRGPGKRSGESFGQHVRRLRWYTRNKPRDFHGNLRSPYYAVSIYQHWQQIQMAAVLGNVVGVDKLYELREMMLYGKVREPFYWWMYYLTLVKRTGVIK